MLWWLEDADYTSHDMSPNGTVSEKTDLWGQAEWWARACNMDSYSHCVSFIVGPPGMTHRWRHPCPAPGAAHLELGSPPHEWSQVLNMRLSARHEAGHLWDTDSLKWVGIVISAYNSTWHVISILRMRLLLSFLCVTNSHTILKG